MIKSNKLKDKNTKFVLTTSTVDQGGIIAKIMTKIEGNLFIYIHECKNYSNVVF